MKKRALIAAVALSVLPLAAYAQNTFPNSGPAGIGTTSPQGMFDVLAASQNSYFESNAAGGYSRIFVNNDAGGGFYMLAYGSAFGGTSTYGGLANAGLTLLLGTSSNNGLVIGSNGPYPLVLSTFHEDRLRIDASGNVGIGVTSPTAKLDVSGNVHVSGNLVTDGNIAAKYQDVAEWVPASEPMEPGTVVVVNRSVVNEVSPSTEAYDTAVAGVVSASPGVILGEASASKVRVATTGRVKVRVDASLGPIRVGDLLVSGTKLGTAMKSQPVDIAGVKMHRPGTVVGKALEPLATGEGEILVLLALQ